ncbi:hypothetical protein ACFWBV_22340 [Streptomyces sp. NPDC060030]|uniref:hypothetical protein n=1 Tax=Streptomyces sp. NPDC060030 TaxID=3347042 RepID=UPI0036CE6123
MTIDEIIGFMQGLDGVLAVTPAPGDGSPEISWGTRSSPTPLTELCRRRASRSRRS